MLHSCLDNDWQSILHHGKAQNASHHSNFVKSVLLSAEGLQTRISARAKRAHDLAGHMKHRSCSVSRQPCAGYAKYVELDEQTCDQGQ